MPHANTQISILPDGHLEFMHSQHGETGSLTVIGSHGYMTMHLSVKQAEQVYAQLGVMIQEMRDNPAGLLPDDEISLAPEPGEGGLVAIQP